MSGAIVCATCGRDLTLPDAVAYEEHYSARLEIVDDKTTAVPRSSSVDSRATCRACGIELSYGDVEFEA